MATDIIRPLSESTGKRIADTLDILTNGGTVTDTSVVIPETVQTEHDTSYYYDANPDIVIPKSGSTLTMTYNGQVYTAKYAGMYNNTNFKPSSSEVEYYAQVYYSDKYVQVNLRDSTKDGEPYVDGDNRIKLEATTEKARKGVLELMASSGGGSWSTVIPEMSLTDFYSDATVSDVDYTAPTEEGGVYAITIDGVRYGASMYLSDGYPYFEAKGVSFDDSSDTTSVQVYVNSKDVHIQRGNSKSGIDITVSVEKLG